MLAEEELPHMDIMYRGAVSIARRFLVRQVMVCVVCCVLCVVCRMFFPDDTLGSIVRTCENPT